MINCQREHRAILLDGFSGTAYKGISHTFDIGFQQTERYRIIRTDFIKSTAIESIESAAFIGQQMCNGASAVWDLSFAGYKKRSVPDTGR